jgi:predicted nucleic acid-binding Zn ribbon protein
MALTTCPICSKQVSEESHACPHCGHPFRSEAKKKGSNGFMSSGLVLIVVVIILSAAFISKPNESKMRDEVCTKVGALACVAATFAESLGTVTISYHDYLVFSTLTIKSNQQPEKNIALGVFGQVFAGDAREERPERSR